MKKSLLLISLVMVFSLQGFSQLISDGFEAWTGGDPDGWMGIKSSIESDSVIQYSTSVHGGTYAAQLVNAQSSHKRFTTDSVSVNGGDYYAISYWVRGHGNIRTNSVDISGSGTYGTYNSYHNINSATWTHYIDNVMIQYSGSLYAEFIFSVQYTEADIDHIQIDDVTITALSIVTPDVSIYDIQYSVGGDSPYDGQAVNTGGIVTAVTIDTTGYWLQAGSGSWSGIYVLDYNNIPAIGDSITLTGTVDEWYNLTELKSVSNYTVVSSGNPVQSYDIAATAADTEEYESVLLSVTNEECLDTWVGYGMWAIGVVGDSLFVGDDIYDYNPTQGTHYNVTGVLYYSYSTWELLPRMASDVSEYTGIEENGISAEIYPNPASDFVQINADMNGTVEIFNINGQLVYNAEFNNSLRINVSEFNSGLYNIVLTNENGTRNTQRILVD
mgnify:CR=1 FL=1